MKMYDRGLEMHENFSEIDKTLWEKVLDFGEYFEDMTFEDESIARIFNIFSYENSETKESLPFPHELKFFSYNFFTYTVVPSFGKCSDGEIAGQFNGQEQNLSICEKYLDCDHIILHEMIHLHEFVLSELPLFYHDVVLWYLYHKLKSKVKNIDEAIYIQGSLGQSNYYKGGNHDILFYLKSLDLDLEFGYDLGTVCSYGASGFDYQLI